MEEQRQYTPMDHLICQFDQALRTLFGRPKGTGRPNPAEGVLDEPLTEAERQESVRLVRVDHTGEVCAQALYQGQALTARLDQVRERMEQAAHEENDHLLWCEERLRELDGHTSLLNPFFYLGSLSIGALAGAIGDRWSLGFVAETERQVIRHLDDHLARLPQNDHRSRAILEQMKEDEAKHGNMARAAGGAELPVPVKRLMQAMSKVMTGTTYWI